MRHAIFAVLSSIFLASTVAAGAEEKNHLQGINPESVMISFYDYALKETASMSALEVDSMVEIDALRTADREPLNIFGRGSTDKLDDLPPFLKAAALKTEADILNYGIDTMGLREWMNLYNRYTQFDFKFGVRESIGQGDSDKKVGLETKASVQFDNDFGTRIGVKLDPRAIDSFDKLTNTYVFAENIFGGVKSELRYATFDQLTLRLGGSALIRGLNFEGEYRFKDQTAGFGAVYHIDQDWMIKFWGRYPRPQYDDPHSSQNQEAAIIFFFAFK